MSNDKHPITGIPATQPLVLRAFYLQPGVTYNPSCPGLPSSLSYWTLKDHSKLVPEEQKNGDIWITTPRGERIEISVLAIATKVRGPAVLPGVEAVRRAQ